MPIKTDKRFSILVLPYDKKDLSMAKELMIDYDNGHMYVKSKDGTKILSITKDIEIKLDNIINNAGDNIHVSLEGFDSTTLQGTLEELKKYIDAMVQGLSVKTPAKAISHDNLPLIGLPIGGIDDVEIHEHDQVLLNGQTNAAENGKWIVRMGAWERPPDFNEDAEAISASFVFIERGTLYGDSGWILSTDGDIILDTTPLHWEIFSRSEVLDGGVGIVKNGNLLSLEEIVEPGEGFLITYDQYGRVTSSRNPESFTELGIYDVVTTDHIGKGDEEHAMATDDNHGFMTNQHVTDLMNNTQAIKDIEIELTSELQSKAEVELLVEVPNVSIQLQSSGMTVIDNLNSTSTNSPLSANQGKVLNDKFKQLFSNMNPTNPVYFNIWTGTIDQYEAISVRDQNTIYYVSEIYEPVISNDVSDNSVTTDDLEHILEMLYNLEDTKADRAGDTFTGTVNIGNEDDPQDIKVYGEITYGEQSIREVFADINHTHSHEDIHDLSDVLDQKAELWHTHNLSSLQQDDFHRTVTIEQIARWDAAIGNGGDNSNVSVLSKLVSSVEHITIEDETPIIIYKNKYTKDEHVLMLFINSTFIEPDRYSIGEGVITLIEEEGTIEIGSKVTVLILGINSVVLDEVQEEPNPINTHQPLMMKSNPEENIHRHTTADIDYLDMYIESMNAGIMGIKEALAYKVNTSPGKVLSDNNFSNDYKKDLEDAKKEIATLKKQVNNLLNVVNKLTSK